MTLIQSTQSVFQQLTQLLVSLEDKHYSLPLKILNGNTIGKHIRHIVEFYECLLDCSVKETSLDYDLRKRSLVYETDTQKVIQVIEILSQKIGLITNSGRNIELYFTTHSEEDVKIRLGTTIERELAYNLEHSIHHMAIIRIAVNHYFKDINLDHSFGVAPSTLKYINSSIEEPLNR